MCSTRLVVSLQLDSERNARHILLDCLREYRLNDEGGYGGRDGWTTVKTWNVEKNVGKIEREAQKLLEKYKVEKFYIHSGDLTNTKELFECPVPTAIEAVKSAMEKYK